MQYNYVNGFKKIIQTGSKMSPPHPEAMRLFIPAKATLPFSSSSSPSSLSPSSTPRSISLIHLLASSDATVLIVLRGFGVTCWRKRRLSSPWVSDTRVDGTKPN